MRLIRYCARAGLLATVFLTAGLSIRAAYAIPVHVDVGYSIDTTFGGFPGLANVALSLDYDTDATATTPGGQRFPLSAAGTINGTPLAILNSFIMMSSDVAFDRFQFNTVPNQAFGGVTLIGLGLVLEGPPTLFNPGDGPFVIDPEDFTLHQAFITWQSGGGLFGASSFSPTITVSVPEPGTLLLILAGLLGVGLSGCRTSLNAAHLAPS